MEAQSSSSSERLPRELYREIVKHLNPHHDPDTLLAFCLVSHALQIEGQRVLFSLGPIHPHERHSNSVNPHVKYSNSRTARAPESYMEFLGSLLGDNKSRLARYVIEYEHISTLEYRDQDHRWTEKTTEMLMDALPMMENLKSLSIGLANLQDSQMAALSNITSFQLHALSITPPNISSELFLRKFLHSQQSVTHLTILKGQRPITKRTIDSLDGIFPRLISLKTSNISLWQRLSLRNDVKGVHLVGCESLDNEHVPALRKLKYLRFGHVNLLGRLLDEFWSRPNVLSIPAGVDLDIEVLRMHMEGDIHKTVYDLTQSLQQLRILIAWEESMWQISGAKPLVFFRRVAAIAFSRCSNLLYVIVPNLDTPFKATYLYQRSPQTAAGEGPVLEEYQFLWDEHADAGAEWWVEWEDILSGTSMLDLPSRSHATILDMSDNYSSDGLYHS